MPVLVDGEKREMLLKLKSESYFRTVLWQKSVCDGMRYHYLNIIQLFNAKVLQKFNKISNSDF